MTKTRSRLKRLSAYGFCVSENDLLNVLSQNHMKKKFIESHDLYVYAGRVYTPVKFQNNPSILFWMDCITGTLFHKNGSNPNSKLKINIRSLRKNQDIGASILMNTKQTYQIVSDVHQHLMFA